jgi:TolB-like protein
MNAEQPPPPSRSPEQAGSDRLDSWKEIAAYLRREVRTLHRWEIQEGLPIHRHLHKERGTVYAYKSELNTWWQDRRQVLERKGQVPAATRRLEKKYVVAILIALTAVAGLATYVSRKLLSPKTTPAGKVMLAVLPFENLDGGQEQEYFSDGLTEEVITRLGGLQPRRLGVIARTAAMHYKHTGSSPSQIGRELSVDYILEGTVRREGTRARVTAQLFKVSSNTQVWADSYERDLGDIVTLQVELARAIAQQVQVTSNSLGRSAQSSGPRFNPEAHDDYLRGRYFWFRGDGEKTRTFYLQAIEKDPAYALAYSGLADYYVGGAVIGFLSPAEALPLGEAAAVKALAIDDSVAEAHNSLAAAKFFFHWDPTAAENECKRAIEFNPSLAEVHHLYAYILEVLNRPAEAFQEERKDVELDPFSRPWGIGYAYYRARRFDAAIEELQNVLKTQPDSAWVRQILSDAYLLNGEYVESLKEFKRARVLMGQPEAAQAVEYSYNRGGWEAMQRWKLGELSSWAKHDYVSPLEYAQIYASLQQRDQAITALEQAVAQHVPRLIQLNQNPYFDPLHSDPRYQAILSRIGLH